MTREQSIIELGDWLETPQGRCLLHWEQRQLDQLLVDVFGFHALQLGLPKLQALQTNRMPDRWLAATWCTTTLPDPSHALPTQGCADDAVGQVGVSVVCLPEALPFPDQSLDLVVMPHTLELAQDPHQALAEAVRVLRPQGRLVVLGLNPVSLWALRQRAGHWRASVGWRRDAPLYLPRAGEFLGFWRVRDWLRLLSMAPEVARFGCYRPACRTAQWLDRWSFVEPIGERWWPVFGAAYLIQAVKQVRGMRLVGLAASRPAKRAHGKAVVARTGCEHGGADSSL